VIKFPARGWTKVLAWCEENIGERKYVIKDRIGGKGWEIGRLSLDRRQYRYQGGYYLKIDDEEMRLIAVLKWGHKND